MLRILSIRYKLIVLAALLVGLVGLLAASYASWLAFQNARSDLHAQALADAHLYQHVLLDPLRLEDDFHVYELISAPFKSDGEAGEEFPKETYAKNYLVGIALLDDAGRVLATSDPKEVPLDSMFATDEPEFTTAAPPLESIREHTQFTLFSIGQGSKFYVVGPVGENGVKYANLVLEYSQQELIANVISRTEKLVGAILLITLFVIVLAWFVANRFTVPLRQLSWNMQMLAERHGFRLGGGGQVERDEVLQLREVFGDLEQALDAAEREKAEARERIQHQAEHDALTGLPNRLLVSDRMEQAIARAARDNEQIAVMFLDLDHFKHVNDLLGHQAGDNLLRMVSQRLLGTVRASDTVSRIGGDEFLIMLAPITEDEACLVAEKIIQAVSAPYTMADGGEINTTTSIGISLYPEGGATPESLSKSADEAMYCAKRNGRNNYQIFTPDMHGEAFERASVESQLRQAIRQQQFILHYQPQLELASDRITGLEALLRWSHPQRGLVSPAEFIHIAEESGLIVEIGAWVIDEVCRQMRAWKDAGESVPTVAVNISLRQFHQQDLQAVVEEALERHGLPGSSLELELTESVMLREPGKVMGVLQNLRAHGVRVSIDDFGTGYSSLLYLRQLNIDALKIDRSFVMDILHPQGRAMVKVINDVARVLGLRTIAEGVESEEQLQALRLIGCDEIQGYLFSVPLPPDQVMELLRQHAGQRQARRTG